MGIFAGSFIIHVVGSGRRGRLGHLSWRSLGLRRGLLSFLILHRRRLRRRDRRICRRRSLLLLLGLSSLGKGRRDGSQNDAERQSEDPDRTHIPDHNSLILSFHL